MFALTNPDYHYSPLPLPVNITRQRRSSNIRCEEKRWTGGNTGPAFLL